jgi:hypothetical protein
MPYNQQQRHDELTRMGERRR